jgi:DNA-binding response OmpR family regulator
MLARHLLVVDDDPQMRNVIGDFLARSDFRVSTAADGASMARIIAQDPVDLVILDIKLNNENGLDLMRALPDQTEAPIIVVTGHAKEEADRVVGLELGADDYVTKPFSLRELLARVRAVLRRSEAAGQRARSREKRARYQFAGWELDIRRRRLTSPSGEVVGLTAGEFNLLAALLRSPQQVLSREQLLAATRVHDEEVFDRSIDVQILRLRRKLEADASHPRLIRTERGAGYILDAEVELI